MTWESYCGCSSNISGCIFNFTAVDNGDLSPCLQLIMQGSGSILLFFASLCYFFNFMGYRHGRVSNQSTLHYITLMRCWLSVFVGCSSLAGTLIRTNEIGGDNELGKALYYTVIFISFAAWVALAVMFYTARFRFPLYKRGPAVVILLYLVNIAIFGKALEAYWLSPVGEYRSTIILLYSVTAVSHVFLLTALIPSGIEYSSPSHHSGVQDLNGDESAALVTGTNNVSYRTFGSETAVHKGEDGNIFSRLIFWWVQPLMKRGKIGLIQLADDVFEVSSSELTNSQVSSI